MSNANKTTVGRKDTKSELVGFLLWLIWVFIAIIVLGTVIYLFIGGSNAFSVYNQEPIIIYEEVNNNGTVSLTGSLQKPSACDMLNLETEKQDATHVLKFTFSDIDDCNEDAHKSTSETFFTQINADNNAQITATVEGVKREVIIK